jgi:hypothetical protein
MGIKGVAPFADIDDDVVTCRHLNGRAFGQLARHLFSKGICDLNDNTVGNRVDRKRFSDRTALTT